MAVAVAADDNDDDNNDDDDDGGGDVDGHGDDDEHCDIQNDTHKIDCGYKGCDGPFLLDVMSGLHLLYGHC